MNRDIIIDTFILIYQKLLNKIENERLEKSKTSIMNQYFENRINDYRTFISDLQCIKNNELPKTKNYEQS
jgi:hypothetical protein